MRKILIVFLMIIGAVLVDLGCVALFERPLFATKDDSDSVDQKYYGLFYDVVDCFETETVILPKRSKFACPAAEISTVLPALRVNGEIYYWTFTTHTMAKCGVMDGRITSTVDSNELPYKDNQSNFGTDIEYQFGAEGTVEIFQDGVWRIYASQDYLEMYSKSYNEYRLITDLTCGSQVDCRVLVYFNGVLYARSNALIDYLGGTEPIGLIVEQIPEFYVPKENGQTNQSFLVNAEVHAGGKEGIVLYYENNYVLFEKNGD